MIEDLCHGDIVASVAVVEHKQEETRSNQDNSKKKTSIKHTLQNFQVYFDNMVFKKMLTKIKLPIALRTERLGDVSCGARDPKLRLLFRRMTMSCHWDL